MFSLSRQFGDSLALRGVRRYKIAAASYFTTALNTNCFILFCPSEAQRMYEILLLIYEIQVYDEHTAVSLI